MLYCFRQNLIWCVFVLCAFAYSNVAISQTKQELENYKRQLKEEIERANAQLGLIKSNKKNSLGEIAAIKKKLQLRNQKIQLINKQLEVIQNQISQYNDEITHIKSNQEKIIKTYKAALIYDYKQHRALSSLMYIFSAKTFSVFLNNFFYYKRYRDFRLQQLDRIRDSKQKLQSSITRLSSTKQAHANVLIEQKKESEILKIEEKEKAEFIKSLSQNEKRLVSIINEKKVKWEKIKRLIQQTIKKEIQELKKRMANKHKEPVKPSAIERKEKANKKVITESLTYNEMDFKIAENFEYAKGRLPWPVEGIVTMKYGKNAIAEGSSVSYNNSGITIQSSEPSRPIKSIFNGVVTSVQNIGEGALISIRHGQYWSVYAPVSNPTVRAGQTVQIGEMIGYTPNVANGEIEFQLMKETIFLNPENWLK